MNDQTLMKQWKLRIIVICLVLTAVISLTFVFAGSHAGIYSFLSKIRLLDSRCGEGQGAFAFYNVGNGDASCIYNNKVIGLVDTGIETMAGSLVQKLERLKTKTLDFVVISHPHNDHAGGYLHLLKEFHVKRLFILPYSESEFENLALYDVMIEQSLAAGTEICYVTHGMQVEIGGIFLRFYDYSYDTKDENQRSLIVLATVGDKKCLYMGDAGFYIEEQMLRMGMSIEADILKVGHHGSNDASSHQFLLAVSPDYAVICVGQNTYGHPSLETTKRIKNVGSMIYRTDICNSVTFTVHQESLDVSVE